MRALKHCFVDEIPNVLEDGVLYVALEYNTVTHLCACGCRNETVTPLGRTEWRFTYDGEAISLDPSVGNWSLPCRSHYVVRDGLVHWAASWTEEEIEAGREADRRIKAGSSASAPRAAPEARPQEATRSMLGVAARVAAWIRSWWP